MKLLSSTALAFAICVGLAAPGHAQTEFPNRPIRLVVPFQAGSAPDLYTRFLGIRLGEVIRQTVVIENKPGGGGIIGEDAVAKARPDGYTLGYIATQHLLHKHLMRSVPVDPLKDLAPIQLIGNVAQVLVVSNEHPAKSVAEFLQWAKASPHPVTFGSGGLGSPAHLAGQALGVTGGFAVTHVAYKGSPDSLNAVIGGQIDYNAATASTVVPLAKAGKVRVLAVTSAKRNEQLPSAPTLVEAMPNGFVYDTWGMIVAPAQTPKAVIELLHKAVTAVMQEPGTIAFFATSGATAVTLPLEQLPEFMRQEEQKNARWVREANIRPE